MMRRSEIVEVIELVVPAADSEELLFRLEVLAQGAKEARRYRCRLYRLESFRFRARGRAVGQSTEWEDADYRCWVMDENLGIDVQSHPSIAKAKSAAIRRLKEQLGV